MGDAKEQAARGLDAGAVLAGLVQAAGVGAFKTGLGNVGGIVRVSQLVAQVPVQIPVVAEQVVDELAHGRGGGGPFGGTDRGGR
ncbi:hypothetical protein D3C72_2123470 [compost metagenome]